MICPICRQEMAAYKEQPCYNKDRSKEYKRTHFKCEKDDVWMRLEVPVNAEERTPATAGK